MEDANVSVQEQRIEDLEHITRQGFARRRRWLRDRSRSRLPGDGAANVDHDIRLNFRHSNYLQRGIVYVVAH